MSKLIERVKSADKNSVLKWGLLISAGFLGFLANIFDKKYQDKKYEEKLDKEIKAQSERLMKDKAA